jgi:uncharacterized protein with HEPN domain
MIEQSEKVFIPSYSDLFSRDKDRITEIMYHGYMNAKMEKKAILSVNERIAETIESKITITDFDDYINDLPLKDIIGIANYLNIYYKDTEIERLVTTPKMTMQQESRLVDKVFSIYKAHNIIETKKQNPIGI